VTLDVLTSTHGFSYRVVYIRPSGSEASGAYARLGDHRSGSQHLQCQIWLLCGTGTGLHRCRTFSGGPIIVSYSDSVSLPLL
jgi:hypothetical protein